MRYTKLAQMKLVAKISAFQHLTASCASNFDQKPPATPAMPATPRDRRKIFFRSKLVF
jgi:hypothetical protein